MILGILQVGDDLGGEEAAQSWNDHELLVGILQCSWDVRTIPELGYGVLHDERRDATINTVVMVVYGWLGAEVQTPDADGEI